MCDKFQTVRCFNVKERVITAICLLAVVIPVVVLGNYWFIALGIIATTIASWEMLAMHDHAIKVPIWVKIFAIIVILGVVFIPSLSTIGLILTPIWLLFILLCYVSKQINFKTGCFYIKTFIYIGLSFRSLLEIRNHSLILFIFLIGVVILTDSLAYLAGRCFGKHKLAPKISPKKTIEGAIGGWLAGAVFAIAFGLINELFTQVWVLILLAICLPVFSQIGDLVASAMKRKYGIKDYGKIFPGHGGVMDRVDSQLMAGIMLYVILYFGGLR